LLNVIGFVLVLTSVVTGVTTLSGQVVDAAGSPVASAQVFLEPGRLGLLVRTLTSGDGAFLFEDVPPGGVGVFAVAEGHAFGGQHIHVAVDDALPAITIRLAPADTLSGKISDFKGRPVEGARVTRVALLGERKVGIPLAKLKAFGVDEPVSGEDGRFTVCRLPQGGTVALKTCHRQFAQEGLSDLAVGDQDVRISLYPGVLVQGIVRSRDQGLPVLNASILVSNAAAPYDTAVTETDASGRFMLRLKPGVYIYQATSAAYRSMGWRQLTVTGREPHPEVSLMVVGVGEIAGKVCNAVSGEPIAGARLLVEADGNMVGVVRTGRTGVFESDATEGENIVRLEPVPGYHPPELAVQRVEVLESERSEIPTFWLAPIPMYTVQIVAESMEPAPGVIVQVLRPAQFGWRVTDAQGRVNIRVAALPPDGVIVGMAEHPTKPLCALFALRREEIESAKVQMLPMGSVKGRVVTAKRQEIQGAVVGALFGEGLLDDPLWLWRTLANRHGVFEWRAVMPNVAQRCIAAAGEDASGESMPFSLEPSYSKDLGNVVVAEGVAADSIQGRPLKWYANPLLCGTLPDKRARKNKPAWVMYCEAEEAHMVIEGLTVAREILAGKEMLFAVVAHGRYDCNSAPIPVLAGAAPTHATTYLVGSDGKVVLEAFGMPPAHIVQNL